MEKRIENILIGYYKTQNEEEIEKLLVQLNDIKFVNLPQYYQYLLNLWPRHLNDNIGVFIGRELIKYHDDNRGVNFDFLLIPT